MRADLTRLKRIDDTCSTPRAVWEVPAADCREDR